MERNKPKGFGRPANTVGIGTSSQMAYAERERPDNYVQSSADAEYGHITGFRYGITQTGHKHRASPVGRKFQDR